ncbi:unnamed protein product [Vicia faba]|uniref:Uncharacterized protein n=1 Tax=Vicia faba TaxID=3906 RepID=A0AAV0Z2Y0_VICFA|nr:unnamed protein product [Vicia faba]
MNEAIRTIVEDVFDDMKSAELKHFPWNERHSRRKDSFSHLSSSFSNLTNAETFCQSPSSSFLLVPSIMVDVPFGSKDACRLVIDGAREEDGDVRWRVSCGFERIKGDEGFGERLVEYVMEMMAGLWRTSERRGNLRVSRQREFMFHWNFSVWIDVAWLCVDFAGCFDTGLTGAFGIIMQFFAALQHG